MTKKKQELSPKFKSLRSFFLSVLPLHKECDAGEGCCFQEWNACRQAFIDNIALMYDIHIKP